MSNTLPPHHVEAEDSVIGSLLIDPDSFPEIGELIKPSDFYMGENGKIFDAMSNLYQQSSPIDLITLEHESGLPLDRLLKFLNVVPTSINVASYAKIVRELSVKRKMIKAAQEIANYGYDKELGMNDALQKAESVVLGLRDGISDGGIQKPRQYTSDYLDNFFERMNSDDDVLGLPSGFHEVDRLLKGFEKKCLYYLAGRPGMGKSAFAINVASYNALKFGKRIAFFSLETTAGQITNRIVSNMTNIDATRLRMAKLTEDEMPIFYDAVGQISESKLFIDETRGLNANDIKTRCQRLYADHGLDMIVIDHVGLLESIRNLGNRNNELSETSRQLANMASYFNVPILALSQLSRSVEQRQVKKPMLSDLRDSGSLEQDAYAVLLLYRDEYYNGELSDKPNIGEVIVAKSKDGETGSVELFWKAKQASYANLQKREIQL